MWNDGPVSREDGPSDLSGMGNFVTNTHLGTLSQTGSEWERNIIGSGGGLGLLGRAVRSSLQAYQLCDLGEQLDLSVLHP